MIVSSGLKAGATVTSVGAIGTKDECYRNVAEFIVAVQDIAAVRFTLLRTISRAL